MRRIYLSSICWLPVFLVALSLSACRPEQSQPTSPPPSPTATEAPAAPAPLTEEARAKLAQADAADGQVDHVVSKCVTCGLAMKGKVAYAATVEGYTFHLCSADCKRFFEKDPAKMLLALK